ncbi:hypothetical protein Vspart_02286 [Vibrio spartinae]|uniref:Beta-ketoacyl-[acyl-carrier-protein] synthase III C-terminal domain-containing protein n=2 Tax=Vibrio spartinae TaxID=1918945 RepID=A0A1N6M5C8_9VIBR|nr:hypothetical protein Vspart_02286 [Vibrio spartinae]SIO94590.1 hypothetical protein VSP9026_02315 [Vibrio spartinae]
MSRHLVQISGDSVIMENAMTYIVDIQCSKSDSTSFIPLDELGLSHDISEKEARVYQRIYQLEQIAMNRLSHEAMLKETLTALLNQNPALRQQTGYLFYTKTQTHNTFFDKHWLQTLAKSCGLRHWKSLTLSLNHCASGLSAVHLTNRMYQNGETVPVIVLSGEKSFAPDLNKMTVGILGEMSAACLLSPLDGQWKVTASRVKHLSRFYKNPENMSATEKRAMMADFYTGMLDFLRSETLSEPEMILPYNLNLPLLNRVSRELGWEGKLYTTNIRQTGHTYCSDVFYNLLTAETQHDFKRALLFAAGMGVTYSSLGIARH